MGDEKKLKLDLGCGQNRKDGYLGVDISRGPNIDYVMDLEKYPWNFETESVEEIFCCHYIEHVTDFILFMDECYRILIPEGKMMVIAPYWSSVRCWQDPTHKQSISESSFLYYNEGWRKANKLDHYPIKSDFDFTYGYSLDPIWVGRSVEAQQFAIRHYVNVVNDLHITLTKRKVTPA